MESNPLQQIREVLQKHESEFRGITWEPKRLVQTNIIAMILKLVGDLVLEVKDLDFGGLPTASKLRKDQDAMIIAYEKVKRNRLYNQGEFFKQVGNVFEYSGRVFEDLARLDRLGYLNPKTEQEI